MYRTNSAIPRQAGNLLALCLCSLVVDAAPIGIATPAQTQPPTSFGQRSDRPLSPMLQEISELLEQEQALVSALQLRLQKASKPADGLQMERELELVKLRTQRQILEVQLRYAQSEERLEVATHLELAIANLRSQLALLEPVPTQAPTDPNQRSEEN